MGNPDLDRLGGFRHVALTTYRSDGTPVTTCVWIARESDALYVVTHGSAGKVKRIRANPRVELAPSDSRGRPQGGASTAEATVVEDQAAIRRATGVIRRKYGWHYPVLRALMAVRGRGAAAAPVAIRLLDPRPIVAASAALS